MLALKVALCLRSDLSPDMRLFVTVMSQSFFSISEHAEHVEFLSMCKACSVEECSTLKKQDLLITHIIWARLEQPTHDSMSRAPTYLLRLQGSCTQTEGCDCCTCLLSLLTSLTHACPQSTTTDDSCCRPRKPKPAAGQHLQPTPTVAASAGRAAVQRMTPTRPRSHGPAAAHHAGQATSLRSQPVRQWQ